MPSLKSETHEVLQNSLFKTFSKILFKIGTSDKIEKKTPSIFLLKFPMTINSVEKEPEK